MNFFSICVLLLVCTISCFSQEKSSDSIVAIVNDEIITYGEVESKIKDILISIDNSPLTLREKELRKQQIILRVTQNLVDEKLTAQEARRYNISIPESTIKKRVEEELKNTSESSGEVDFSELMRSHLTLQELFQKKAGVASSEKFRATIDTFVSPLEIREYYEKNIQEFTSKKKIKTRIITLFYAKYGGEEQTLAKAESIIKQARQGADFGELAKQYSNDVYAKDGGTWPRLETPEKEEIWGFFAEGEALSREVDAIIFKLKEGEISKPISINDPWCQIIKIESIQEGGTKAFSEVQEVIRQKLRNTKIVAALISMRMKLREKAFIWPPNLFEETK